MNIVALFLARQYRPNPRLRCITFYTEQKVFKLGFNAAVNSTNSQPFTSHKFSFIFIITINGKISNIYCFKARYSLDKQP